MLASSLPSFRHPRTIDVFLLGRVDLQSLLMLQRLASHEVATLKPHRASFILCEHPASFSVGTAPLDDPHAQIAPDFTKRQQATLIRRIGGLWEHGEGQLGIYSTLSLHQTELAPESMRDILLNAFAEAIIELTGRTTAFSFESGVQGRTGLLASSSLTVSNGIGQGTTYLNVTRDYNISREPTSNLIAECMRPLDVQSVKSAVVGQLRRLMPDPEFSVFSTHPLLSRLKSTDLDRVRDELARLESQI